MEKVKQLEQKLVCGLFLFELETVGGSRHDELAARVHLDGSTLQDSTLPQIFVEGTLIRFR